MRILLVEDNENLGEALVTALRQEHYTVDWLRDGRDALQAPFAEQVDAIVLDLGLPGMDGLTLLRHWRNRKLQTPVLILTARDSTDTKVEGLDSGADDFLAKPFERAELMARLRSLLRRSRQAEQEGSIIRFGEVELDVAAHRVSFRGVAVNVSRREFALLQVLLERPGKVFSRDKLQQTLYGWDDDVSSNTVEVYIHNLRKKFYPELIRTLRGIGYASADKPLSS